MMMVGDVDQCPGFDDNIDTDDDGVANGALSFRCK